ncbi:YicC/YloC family endoribonuclease [Parahaliea mediterranea]|uniref:YicC family protein n=1 Tax=Parahaliea mediterranea TaxID=651086 RepID=A0A939IKE6_9GAMM|nr:YicC/YloC family endoribonuclease [Parahaliea mediterranea]MBN7797251.1 YicC family protein [Parahaliea mediterranea]
MTAFARESLATDHGTLVIELRSVNHRYLDCSFKMPDALRALEGGFREQATRGLSRGKLDCMLRLQHQASAQGGPLSVDQSRLAEVLAAARAVADQLPGSQPLNPLEVLQFPGVCVSPEGAEQALQVAADELFKRALTTLRDNRAREGKKLAALVLERLEQVESEVARTREHLPALLRQQRERVVARIEELDTDADPGRLEQELVYMAQKADVDEELDRLDAHIGEVRRTLKKGGPCGRRLDFLMQEFNREANTLSSKSTASSTTASAVELKVLIEQMREQIQNIE